MQKPGQLPLKTGLSPLLVLFYSPETCALCPFASIFCAFTELETDKFTCNDTKHELYQRKKRPTVQTFEYEARNFIRKLTSLKVQEAKKFFKKGAFSNL